ncbi:MAG TPA: hypothetical protein VI893_04840 [Thermoplasmata archaeon]|nr:hypothetical protein [Thermoplasmata archaeon]
MRKKLFLLLALGMMAVPAIARADVSARQDSCVTEEREGITYTKTYFSIVNFSLPTSVCSFRFIPEPQPPASQCTLIDCGHPAGWSCGLNADGGATWSENGAGCIAPGNVVTEFWYELDPGFCCYIVEFYDDAGNLLASQEECFCEKPVQSQTSTWGQVKGIYR